MSFKSKCSECGFEFEAEDEWIEQEAECSSCNKVFTVQKIKDEKQNVIIGGSVAQKKQMNIKCPHCFNFQEVKEEALQTLVNCKSCGKEFKAKEDLLSKFISSRIGWGICLIIGLVIMIFTFSNTIEGFRSQSWSQVKGHVYKMSGKTKKKKSSTITFYYRYKATARNNRGAGGVTQKGRDSTGGFLSRPIPFQTLVPNRGLLKKPRNHANVTVFHHPKHGGKSRLFPGIRPIDILGVIAGVVLVILGGLGIFFKGGFFLKLFPKIKKILKMIEQNR